jgi:hypothetical protein
LDSAKRGAVDRAFLFAMNDATATFRGINTKAVINYSAGKPPWPDLI